MAQRSPLLALAMLLFSYLIITKRMYIDAPERPGRVSVAPALSVLLCALGVVALGVYPKPLVMAALRVTSALF